LPHSFFSIVHSNPNWFYVWLPDLNDAGIVAYSYENAVLVTSNSLDEKDLSKTYAFGNLNLTRVPVDTRKYFIFRDLAPQKETYRSIQISGTRNTNPSLSVKGDDGQLIEQTGRKEYMRRIWLYNSGDKVVQLHGYKLNTQNLNNCDQMRVQYWVRNTTSKEEFPGCYISINGTSQACSDTALRRLDPDIQLETFEGSTAGRIRVDNIYMPPKFELTINIDAVCK
jgi:hypothetical protein